MRGLFASSVVSHLLPVVVFVGNGSQRSYSQTWNAQPLADRPGAMRLATPSAFRLWLSGWLAGVGLVWVILGWIYGATMMQLCRENRLHAQAALLFLNHFQPDFAQRIDAGTSFV